MKHFLLICLVALFSISFAQAQFDVCQPDVMYADSAFGVYPPPFDTVTMTGGIDESACIGQAFYYALTLVVPPTVQVPPITANVETIIITNVLGLPSGLEIACNPPSCEFVPEDSLVCAYIFGTADESNAPGEYPLSLEGEIKTNITTITFEQLFILLQAGSYSLTLEPNGSPTCTVVATEEPLNDHVRIETAPNPFTDFTTIQIHSDITDELELNVYNLLGEQVHAQTIFVSSGTNSVEFDGSRLAVGVYHFTFTDGQSILSQKLLVQR